MGAIPLVDMYVPARTRLHRLDPRVKIILAVLLTAICFFLTSLLILLGLFLLLQLLIGLSGVSLRRYSSSVWLVARFAILFVLLWPFFDRAGEPVLLDLSVYRMTLPSLLRSLTVALRIMVIASSWFLLLFTTRQSALIRGMVKLGLPYTLGLSLAIALRYIPHFISTMELIREAQLSRGFVIDSGGPLRRARNFVPVLIPTIILALRTSEGLTWSLISRGYGSSRKRSYHRDIRMRATDAVVLVLILMALPLLLIIEVVGVAQL